MAAKRIAAYQKDQFPIQYSYQSTGLKTAKVSSNISALQVIGDEGPENNTATTQLVEVKFND